jgi:hypothetical protein
LLARLVLFVDSDGFQFLLYLHEPIPLFFGGERRRAVGEGEAFAFGRPLEHFYSI